MQMRKSHLHFLFSEDTTKVVLLALAVGSMFALIKI